MGDEQWEERLRAAAAKGHAHEQAKEEERRQARQDLETTRMASSRCLDETIAPALKEALDVAGAAGLVLELITLPPDPDVALRVRSSLMTYEIQADGTILLRTHLPSGRVDKEHVPTEVAAEAIKARVAKFVEDHVNETILQRSVK